MNGWILYGIPGFVVFCLVLVFFLELKAGYPIRKAIKDTLSFGGRHLLLGFAIGLVLIALYKLADWLWEALV